MLTKTNVSLLREFLATQANHWAFYPAVILFAETTRLSGISVLGWVILGLLPTLLYIAREIIQSFLLQISLAPIMVGIIYVLPIYPEIMKGSYLFFVMAYLMLSLLKTIKKSDPLTHAFPPFIPLCINLVLSVIAVYVTKMNFSFLMHVSAIISVIFSLLAFYLDRYRNFILANEANASNVPKSKMLKSGLLSSSEFLVILAAIMTFIATFSISDDFFRKIIDRLQLGTKGFFAFLKKLFPEATKVPKRLSDGAQSEPFQITEHARKNPSIFSKIIESILYFAVIALVCALVLYLVYRILSFFMVRKKVLTVMDAEEGENEIIDLHESITQKVIFKEEGEDDSLLSPTLRIRKLYRKKAQSTHRTNLELSLITAREFATEEKIPEIAPLYEKARYSQTPCTKEDLKLMQEACRRKKSES